jgi:hypothetical protein
MCSNAMNALSEDNSLLQMPVWRNPWLLVAMAVSLGLHAVILYVPLLAGGWLGGWLAGWRAPAGWLAFVLAWLAWAVLKKPARSGHGWNLLLEWHLWSFCTRGCFRGKDAGVSAPERQHACSTLTATTTATRTAILCRHLFHRASELQRVAAGAGLLGTSHTAG